MSGDRYYAKVVQVQDKYTVIINAGSERGLRIGSLFLIVGLGETIVDPDTNEELERLEIVRGKAEVTHVQSKIATLRSAEYERASDVKEIKKVTSRGGSITSFMPQDTVTELIKPGEEHIKELKGAQIGDFAIEL
jgi:hypothetical protein